MTAPHEAADPHGSAPALRNHLRDFSAAVLAEHGEVRPRFLAITSEGKAILVAAVWADEDEKALILDKLRRFFRQTGIVRYGMICEAWMLTRSPGDPFIEPRLSDRRIEIVTVAVADRDGTKTLDTYSLDRDGDGKPSLGARLDEPPGGALGGRMLSLLDD